MPTDSVCGMAVSKEEAPARATHEGRTYHFCSASCRDAFAGNPEYYLEGLVEEDEEADTS